MTQIATKPRLLTTEEASAHFEGKISTKTLNNWRNLGSGPPFMKIGGKVFYKMEDLLAWEEQRTVRSTSQYKKTT